MTENKKEMNDFTQIIYAIIKKRHALGMSQRELAERCRMPQSSVARLESLKTTPKLDTLIKITKPLGLQLSVSESLISH